MDSRFHLRENFVSEYVNRLLFFKVLLFEFISTEYTIMYLVQVKFLISIHSLLHENLVDFFISDFFTKIADRRVLETTHCASCLAVGRTTFKQSRRLQIDRGHCYEKLPARSKRQGWSDPETSSKIYQAQDYGWASSLSRMLHSLYLYRTFERKKENSSSSNILPSTQQYNRSISATLLPAVAAFDKKPHIRQNMYFLKDKKKREEEATRRISTLVLAMHTIICLTFFREL